MNTDFKDVMSMRTDDELIRIVTVDRDGYQSIAIEAAEDEIKKRNIETTKIEYVKKDLTSKIEEQKRIDSKKVGSSIRLVHLFIDTIAINLLILVISFFFVPFFNTTDQFFMSVSSYLIIAIGFFSYYIFMETMFQKTFGKFITKTKVVTKDGKTPKLGDIVIRTFCRFVPFDHISFLFTANGFHDRLSDTTLVKDDDKK